MFTSDHSTLFRRETRYRVGEASVDEFMTAIEKHSEDEDLFDVMQAIKLQFLKTVAGTKVTL